MLQTPVLSYMTHLYHFFLIVFKNHVPLCLFSLDDPDMAHLYQYLIFFFFSKSFACLNGKLEEK